MVYLRSGRTTGAVELTPRPFRPKVPLGGMFLLFPMRVGECVFPDGSSKGGYLAIVGRTTTCLGKGTDLVSAADDATFKMDAYMEDDYISSKEDCYSFHDDPFHMERDLLDTGMEWRGPVADCEVFLTVSQGKVISFGWQKKGDEEWRVFEEPKLQSLH